MSKWLTINDLAWWTRGLLPHQPGGLARNRRQGRRAARAGRGGRGLRTGRPPAPRVRGTSPGPPGRGVQTRGARRRTRQHDAATPSSTGHSSGTAASALSRRTTSSSRSAGTTPSSVQSPRHNPFHDAAHRHPRYPQQAAHRRPVRHLRQIRRQFLEPRREHTAAARPRHLLHLHPRGNAGTTPATAHTAHGDGADVDCSDPVGILGFLADAVRIPVSSWLFRPPVWLRSRSGFLCSGGRIRVEAQLFRCGWLCVRCFDPLWLLGVRAWLGLGRSGC